MYNYFNTCAEMADLQYFLQLCSDLHLTAHLAPYLYFSLDDIGRLLHTQGAKPYRLTVVSYRDHKDRAPVTH